LPRLFGWLVTLRLVYFTVTFYTDVRLQFYTFGYRCTVTGYGYVRLHVRYYYGYTLRSHAAPPAVVAVTHVARFVATRLPVAVCLLRLRYRTCTGLHALLHHATVTVWFTHLHHRTFTGYVDHVYTPRVVTFTPLHGLLRYRLHTLICLRLRLRYPLRLLLHTHVYCVYVYVRLHRYAHLLLHTHVLRFGYRLRLRLLHVYVTVVVVYTFVAGCCGCVGYYTLRFTLYVTTHGYVHGYTRLHCGWLLRLRYVYGYAFTHRYTTRFTLVCYTRLRLRLVGSRYYHPQRTLVDYAHLHTVYVYTRLHYVYAVYGYRLHTVTFGCVCGYVCHTFPFAVVTLYGHAFTVVHTVLHVRSVTVGYGLHYVLRYLPVTLVTVTLRLPVTLPVGYVYGWLICGYTPHRWFTFTRFTFLPHGCSTARLRSGLRCCGWLRHTGWLRLVTHGYVYVDFRSFTVVTRSILRLHGYVTLHTVYTFTVVTRLRLHAFWLLLRSHVYVYVTAVHGYAFTVTFTRLRLVTYVVYVCDYTTFTTRLVTVTTLPLRYHVYHARLHGYVAVYGYRVWFGLRCSYVTVGLHTHTHGYVCVGCRYVTFTGCGCYHAHTFYVGYVYILLRLHTFPHVLRLRVGYVTFVTFVYAHHTFTPHTRLRYTRCYVYVYTRYGLLLLFTLIYVYVYGYVALRYTLPLHVYTLLPFALVVAFTFTRCYVYRTFTFTLLVLPVYGCFYGCFPGYAPPHVAFTPFTHVCHVYPFTVTVVRGYVCTLRLLPHVYGWLRSHVRLVTLRLRTVCFRLRLPDYGCRLRLRLLPRVYFTFGCWLRLRLPRYRCGLHYTHRILRFTFTVWFTRLLRLFAVTPFARFPLRTVGYTHVHTRCVLRLHVTCGYVTGYTLRLRFTVPVTGYRVWLYAVALHTFTHAHALPVTVPVTVTPCVVATRLRFTHAFVCRVTVRWILLRLPHTALPVLVYGYGYYGSRFTPFTHVGFTLRFGLFYAFTGCYGYGYHTRYAFCWFLFTVTVGCYVYVYGYLVTVYRFVTLVGYTRLRFVHVCVDTVTLRFTAFTAFTFTVHTAGSLRLCCICFVHFYVACLLPDSYRLPVRHRTVARFTRSYRVLVGYAFGYLHVLPFFAFHVYAFWLRCVLAVYAHVLYVWLRCTPFYHGYVAVHVTRTHVHVHTLRLFTHVLHTVYRLVTRLRSLPRFARWLPLRLRWLGLRVYTLPRLHGLLDVLPLPLLPYVYALRLRLRFTTVTFTVTTAFPPVTLHTHVYVRLVRFLRWLHLCRRGWVTLHTHAFCVTTTTPAVAFVAVGHLFFTTTCHGLRLRLVTGSTRLHRTVTTHFTLRLVTTRFLPAFTRTRGLPPGLRLRTHGCRGYGCYTVTYRYGLVSGSLRLRLRLRWFTRFTRSVTVVILVYRTRLHRGLHVTLRYGFRVVGLRCYYTPHTVCCHTVALPTRWLRLRLRVRLRLRWFVCGYAHTHTHHVYVFVTVCLRSGWITGCGWLFRFVCVLHHTVTVAVTVTCVYARSHVHTRFWLPHLRFTHGYTRTFTGCHTALRYGYVLRLRTALRFCVTTHTCGYTLLRLVYLCRLRFAYVTLRLRCVCVDTAFLRLRLRLVYLPHTWFRLRYTRLLHVCYRYRTVRTFARLRTTLRFGYGYVTVLVCCTVAVLPFAGYGYVTALPVGFVGFYTHYAFTTTATRLHAHTYVYVCGCLRTLRTRGWFGCGLFWLRLHTLPARLPAVPCARSALPHGYRCYGSTFWFGYHAFPVCLRFCGSHTAFYYRFGCYVFTGYAFTPHYLYTVGLVLLRFTHARARTLRFGSAVTLVYTRLRLRVWVTVTVLRLRCLVGCSLLRLPHTRRGYPVLRLVTFTFTHHTRLRLVIYAVTLHVYLLFDLRSRYRLVLRSCLRSRLPHTLFLRSGYVYRSLRLRLVTVARLPLVTFTHALRTFAGCCRLRLHVGCTLRTVTRYGSFGLRLVYVAVTFTFVPVTRYTVGYVLITFTVTLHGCGYVLFGWFARFFYTTVVPRYVTVTFCVDYGCWFTCGLRTVGLRLHFTLRLPHVLLVYVCGFTLLHPLLFVVRLVTVTLRLRLPFTFVIYTRYTFGLLRSLPDVLRLLRLRLRYTRYGYCTFTVTVVPVGCYTFSHVCVLVLVCYVYRFTHAHHGSVAGYTVTFTHGCWLPVAAPPHTLPRCRYVLLVHGLRLRTHTRYTHVTVGSTHYAVVQVPLHAHTRSFTVRLRLPVWLLHGLVHRSTRLHTLPVATYTFTPHGYTRTRLLRLRLVGSFRFTVYTTRLHVTFTFTVLRLLLYCRVAVTVYIRCRYTPRALRLFCTVYAVCGYHGFTARLRYVGWTTRYTHTRYVLYTFVA